MHVYVHLKPAQLPQIQQEGRLLNPFETESLIEPGAHQFSKTSWVEDKGTLVTFLIVVTRYPTRIIANSPAATT